MINPKKAPPLGQRTGLNQNCDNCITTATGVNNLLRPPEPMPAWIVEDLARSGIPQTRAAELGLRPVSDADYQGLLGFSGAQIGCGYTIPFYDPATSRPMKTPDGRPFLRVRLQVPAEFPDGTAKYLSPKNSGQHAYILKSVHGAFAGGAAVTLTEGEKKAVRATDAGIPTIGLTGNWGFHDSCTGDLLADLEPYAMPGGVWTVIWDSDAAFNHEFAVATHRLRTCLQNRRVKLRALILPFFPGVPVPKVGVDDYLQQHSPDELKDLINGAQPVDGTVNDIYSTWLAGYIRGLQTEQMELGAVAVQLVSKGLFDRLDASTRRRVAAGIENAVPLLASAIDTEIRARLDQGFTSVAIPAHGGQSLKTGCYVRAPNYDTPLKVDSLDRDIVYCFLPNAQHASRPFYRKHLVLTEKSSASAENGKAGGRPRVITVTAIANAFLARPENTIEGVTTARFLRGQWYCYRNGRYDRVQEQDVRSAVMAFLRQHPDYNRDATSNRLADIMNHLKASDTGGMPSNTVLPVWLDGKNSPAPGWGTTSNKLINIRNIAAALHGQDFAVNELSRPLSPRLFTPFCFGYEFDPAAECRLFEEMLLHILPDLAAREALQMLFGLCLVLDTSYNVFFILFGVPGSGKSTVLYIFEHLVGLTNVCHLPFSRFTDKFSVGQLTEHLVNVIGEGDSELPRDAGLGRIEGLLKDVTDGGLITVEHKFNEPGKARATARCIAATNTLPTFYDRSDGIWDRLRIIPFDVRVRGTKGENPRLRQEIVAYELPGILNWAIAGLAKLQGLQRFPEIPAGLQLKTDLRARGDHECEFLTEHFAEGLACEPIPCEALYYQYKGWMTTRSYHPLGEGKFSADVLRVFPKVQKSRVRGLGGKQFRGWVGLKKTEGCAT